MKRVVALGFFDGVHLGHGALLRKTVETARTLGATPSACTFDVHPDTVIFGKPQPLLSTLADREALMKDLYGVEELMVAHFDQKMMTMPWDSFVTDYLVGELGAIHVVAGHDYRFGYKGEGNPEKLKDLCQKLGLGCDIVPKVTLEGQTVSSTYIRSLLAAGETEKACRFLGHPHVLTGKVVHGKGLGRKLGFPTVNLALPNHLLIPAYGVYAAKVKLPSGREIGAATNIGLRPSVHDGGGVTVESFLLDFSGDLYQETLTLELFHHLRWEKSFSSLEELTAEVLKNAGQVKDYLRKLS